LSSNLLTKENFVHGIGFYGSYLGIKRKFKYNIEDEIEQLHNSTFFYENNNKLYTLNKELNGPNDLSAVKCTISAGKMKDPNSCEVQVALDKMPCPSRGCKKVANSFDTNHPVV
jgi:hypothetical protein